MSGQKRNNRLQKYAHLKTLQNIRIFRSCGQLTNPHRSDMGIGIATTEIVSKPKWQTNNKLLFRLLIISFSLNCLTVLYFSGKRYYYSHLDTFKMFKLNTAKIVVLGDSRASGADWNKILQRNDVMNCGIGGYTTGQLIKKLDTAYSYKPSTCIIQIGINDIRNNVSNDTIFHHYTQIIDSLLTHHIKPRVTSIIPLRADYWSDLVDYKVVNAKADSLNHRLILLCKQKDISYVDINRLLVDKNKRLKREYTYDGIHLNDSGYILTGQQIIPYLR